MSLLRLIALGVVKGAPTSAQEPSPPEGVPVTIDPVTFQRKADTPQVKQRAADKELKKFRREADPWRSKNR